MSSVNEIAAAAPLAHSTLGASTSERWGACPGSVKLSEGIPNRTSVYAEEGTLAHEAAATVLEHGAWPIFVDNYDDMREAVTVYVDLIQAESEPGCKVFIEQKLDLSSVHPKMFGTADAVIFYPKKKLLRVYDYKHGKGVAVDVKENTQLMYYGLGAMLQLNLPVETLELIIVQPRCYHEDGTIRRWALPAFEMLDFAATLRELALKTEDPNAALIAGDHCRWCPAAPTCPKLAEKAQEMAQVEFKSVETYDPEKLGTVLNWLDVLENWATSVREFAYREAVAGRVPPGHKLVEKRSSKKWNGDVDAEVLSQNFGIAKAAFLDYSLLSPAGAEKLLKGDQKKKLANFYTSVSTGTTLVAMSDKRPEVRLDARSQFEQLEAKNADIFA